MNPWKNDEGYRQVQRVYPGRARKHRRPAAHRSGAYVPRGEAMESRTLLTTWYAGEQTTAAVGYIENPDGTTYSAEIYWGDGTESVGTVDYEGSDVYIWGPHLHRGGELIW